MLLATLHAATAAYRGQALPQLCEVTTRGSQVGSEAADYHHYWLVEVLPPPASRPSRPCEVARWAGLDPGLLATSAPNTNMKLERRSKHDNLGIDPRMQGKDGKRLMPTGKCWCGCGEETAVGAFFVAGHDKRAEAAVVKTVYGSVPELLIAHGFGPGGKSADKELRRYQKGGGTYL